MSPDYKKFGDNSEEAYITQMIPENMYWSGVADELEEERKIERATVAAEDGKNELLSDLSEKSKHESASSRHNTDKMYLAPTPNLGSPGHTNDPTQKSLSPNRTTLTATTYEKRIAMMGTRIEEFDMGEGSAERDDLKAKK
ncbi:hypothetical protein E4T38_02993 [Aureobasidium subglaciale]|nr:hypothetical protein E4T38_02993 [Aureobasidium subglaciale]KAI5226954.1 hypothetical protein E4T40_02767 [Aureobasidium subglaciale]KAI5230215.1 hypothetical protein E4T41_02990 [Aureobasidium subglaciale]KAI5264723.1 hypothetical protein E4T46_02768 [Aureobasidium subglaciale]